jgi:hypothetical protein
MQINFYMDKPDRDQFHEYIFSRGGYILPSRPLEMPAPIYLSSSDIPDSFEDLLILNESIFSMSNYKDPDWITPWHDRYFTHGPGMLYSPSWKDENGLHRGRIFMGLFSASSFLKSNSDRQGNIYELYKDDVRKVENFFQSCCRNIRKFCRKDDAGFYHGPSSDQLEKNGVIKLQI